MSRNYKFQNERGVYFVSFSVVQWIDVFTRVEYRDIVLDILRFLCLNKGLEIFGWCIMTNHVHLVYRSIGLHRPEIILATLKRFSSRKLIEAIQSNPVESRREWLLSRFQAAAHQSSNVSRFQFWRHDNHPIELWSPAVIDEKLEYVHNNPVEAGWVLQPEHYLYSSAIDYAGGQGLLEGVIVIR